MSEVSIKLYGIALQRVLSARADLEHLKDKPYSITATVEEIIDYYYLNKVI